MVLATIRIIDHKGVQTTHSLDPAKRYRLGRAPENDLSLPDPGLSRRHAEIYCEKGAWYVADAGSSNGTFADDRRIDDPTRLDANLRIRLGGCRLTFTPAAGPDRTVRFSDAPIGQSGTVTLSSVDVIRGMDAQAGGEEEVAMLRRRFAIVQKATLELLAHEPMEALLPKILDLVFEAARPDRAALLSRDAQGELVCRAFRGTDSEGFTISRTIANRVLDQRVSVMTADAQSDAQFNAAKSIETQGIRAVMAVPLWIEDDVIGLVYTDATLSTKRFADEDLKVLTMLGNIAAIQIQNARLFAEQLEKQRLEKEAQAAAEIQHKLLPEGPAEIPGYRFAGHNDPCHEVGGDYYDCVPLGDGTRRGIIIADVSGKGMGAALLMASLQATYHARAEVGPTHSVMIGQLNMAIHRSVPDNRFVTAFVMDLDPHAHRVAYINAGHAPPPVLVRATGEMVLIMPGGPPLGIFPGMEYETGSVELAPLDFIFACSDGVTDVMSPTGEMFGDERLRGLLSRLPGRSPEAVHQVFSEALHAFAAGRHYPDDLTIIVLQRQP